MDCMGLYKNFKIGGKEIFEIRGIICNKKYGFHRGKIQDTKAVDFSKQGKYNKKDNTLIAVDYESECDQAEMLAFADKPIY